MDANDNTPKLSRQQRRAQERKAKRRRGYDNPPPVITPPGGGGGDSPMKALALTVFWTDLAHLDKDGLSHDVIQPLLPTDVYTPISYIVCASGFEMLGGHAVDYWATGDPADIPLILTKAGVGREDPVVGVLLARRVGGTIRYRLIIGWLGNLHRYEVSVGVGPFEHADSLLDNMPWFGGMDSTRHDAEADELIALLMRFVEADWNGGNW